MTNVRAVTSPRTRPRDRKDRIIRAAGDLFHASGYHLVGMGDVAAAVDITAAALYRHFTSKQDLLHQTITRGVEGYASVVDAQRGDGLDALVRRLVEAALEWRSLGVLWQREARHLTADQRADLRARLWHIATQLASALRDERRSLPVRDAELVAACMLSVLTSISYHRARMDRPQLEDLLHRTAMAVAAFTPTAQTAGGSSPSPSPLLRARSSRREQLLTAATQLFARRGYGAVTMEEIGSAAGIAGPSIYNHFNSKTDLLAAALRRGSEWLHLDLSRILAAATTPAEALARLLASYAEFAVHQRDLVQVLISEVPHLPDKQREAELRTQHDYVAEWMSLTQVAHRSLSSAAARTLVQAALTIANDVGRTRRFRDRTGLASDIAAAGRAVLLDHAKSSQ